MFAANASRLAFAAPTAVSQLLLHGAPLDVARLVVPVVIDPVERVQRPAARVLAPRPRTDLSLHLGNEDAHVMPGFMDADAAAAPVLILRPFGVVAAAHHLPVHLVKRVGGKAVPEVHRRRFTVRLAPGCLLGRLPGPKSSGAFPAFLGPRGPESRFLHPAGGLRRLRCRSFPSQAAARLVPAANQVGQGDEDFRAAVTPAHGRAPACGLLRRLPDVQVRPGHLKPAESLADLHEHAGFAAGSRTSHGSEYRPRGRLQLTSRGF